MPTAPPRPCRQSGCRELVRGTDGYCDPHLKARRKASNAARGTTAERGYGHHWQANVRPAALAREPVCRFCAEHGRTTAATVVDHIDGNSHNNDPDNLRSLCKPCHDERTGRDQAWGRKRATSMP